MNSQPIRFSRWTHVFKRNNTYALFHSLNLSLVFLEERFEKIIDELRLGTTLKQLQKLDNDINNIIMELRKLGLVVSVHQDDSAVMREKQQQYLSSPSLETMFMLLTDVCNLRCTYCFIQGSTPKDKKCSTVMQWDVAKQAVDMYFSNLKKNGFHKTIVFYGGEPLLVFPLLKKIVSYIHTEHEKDFNQFKIGLILITNGTKITDEVAEYLSLHPEIGVCISLDGQKSTNDQKRVGVDGEGTFQEISLGIDRLHKFGRTDINISATIDDHNVNCLTELLDLHKKFVFQTVNFNLLLDTEQRTVDPSYTELATKRMIQYFEKAREIGLYEDRIMRKVRALSRGKLHPFDCRATGQQVAVSPDGALGICHEGVGCKNFFFGKVSREFVFSEHPLIREWGQRSPLNMSQCSDCPSVGLCGGGCAYSAYLRHGTIWSVDDKFCKHSLAVLEWLIWDVHSRM